MQKDEKIIFHNINSKAVPIRSERLLEGIIVDSKDELSFSDKELDDSFGHEYLLARKVLKNKPLAIRKLKAIPWIRSDLITALIDIIAKNAKVKERVRVAIATTLDGEAIAPSDSQRLQSILVKHFC